MQGNVGRLEKETSPQPSPQSALEQYYYKTALKIGTSASYDQLRSKQMSRDIYMIYIYIYIYIHTQETFMYVWVPISEGGLGRWRYNKRSAK